MQPMKKPAFLTKDWFSRHGITTRIVLLFLVLVIIPFFVMAAFVVGIFRDYNITALGNSAMDSMASVGYQISGELKNRMESSLFAYYNDIVELLSGETLTESEEKLIEKRLNSSVYSIEGAVAGAIIDRNGKVYRVGNDAMAVSFMEAHQEEVLAAGGRCCWYVMSRVYGRSEKNSYILARSLNNKEMQHVGFLYMVMSDSLVQDAFGQLQSDEAVRYLTDSEGRILYRSRKEADRDHLDISVLDEKKIAYDYCPGVSAFCGAASALNLEYTLPDISQSVIITRMEGRTPVPSKESIQSFAAHQATMVVFLSTGMLEELSRRLVEGGYREDTPAAIVYKATWPEQKTFVCTVGTLAETAARNNITKTALMIIGDTVAAAHYDRSKLYDPGFTTEFREATK